MKIQLHLTGEGVEDVKLEIEEETLGRVLSKYLYSHTRAYVSSGNQEPVVYSARAEQREWWDQS